MTLTLFSVNLDPAIIYDFTLHVLFILNNFSRHFFRLMKFRAKTDVSVRLTLVAVVSYVQGCQMVYFHTKNPNLVYFGGTWNGKCWYIL
jgi:hypothetical protein